MIMKQPKSKMYIASCSFGKDSIATILIALEHAEPIDRIVFSEVMFNREKGISGEIPEHINWIYDTAIPKLENMGVKVDVVRAETDYVSFFNRCRKGGKYEGKNYGFPIGGRCVINRECKLKPIHRYYRQFKDYQIVQYVGIAQDEPRRLARLKKYQISLLDKYGYTESMAMKKCEEYNLISPMYNLSKRGGCWFCMNSKLSGYLHIRRNHPHLWNALRQLSKTPNLCSYGFRYGKALQQVEKDMNALEWNQKHQLVLDF